MKDRTMPRYSKIIIALHWATALLVFAVWFTSEGGRHVRENPPLLHFSLGLAVLMLVIPRLTARLTGGAPRVEDTQAPWLNRAAKIGHTVLYVFLIGLPLTGWYAASRLGVPISFFGLSVPALVSPVQGASGFLAAVHETGGTVILWLAGLHALIACWHQFVLRDGTLRRMSPV